MSLKSRQQDKIILERSYVDNITGEILTQETVQRRGVEPPFVKLYLDCLCNFKGLPISLNPILLEFLKYMTYANVADNHGGQIIYLNAALKRNIAEATGKTVKRIEQALTSFVKSGIFIRIATSTYQVNAELFGKGDWNDIKNIRNIIATFDFKDGTVKTNIVRDTDMNEDDAKEAAKANAEAFVNKSYVMPVVIEQEISKGKNKKLEPKKELEHNAR